MSNRNERRAARKRNLKIMQETSRGRSCGTCTLCCTLFAVIELRKPEGKTCHYLRPERGERCCTRYATRPKSCEEFYCLWRQGEFTEESRPDKTGAVFFAQEENGLMWVEGLAIDEAAVSRWSKQLEMLSEQRHVPVVFKIANTSEGLCFGSDDELLHLDEVYGRRPRRLLVVTQ